MQATMSSATIGSVKTVAETVADWRNSLTSVVPPTALSAEPAYLLSTPWARFLNANRHLLPQPAYDEFYESQGSATNSRGEPRQRRGDHVLVINIFLRSVWCPATNEDFETVTSLLSEAWETLRLPIMSSRQVRPRVDTRG